MRSFLFFFILASVAFASADLSDAKKLIDAKRVPEAKPLVEAILAVEPKNVDALYTLALCQSQMDAGNEAIATLEKALALSPDRVDLLTLHGICCLAEASKQRSLSLTRKMRSSMEKVLELDPRNQEARSTLIGFYSQAPWIAGGSMSKAYALAAEQRKVDPDRGQQSMINLKVKDNAFDEAYSLCQDFLSRHPGDYLTLYQIGRIASNSGTRQAEGLAALEQCLGLPVPSGAPGHAGVYYRLGLIRRKAKNIAESEHCFNEALKLEPDNRDLAKKIAEARKS